MNKNIILETINRLGNDSFCWSEQITDNYLKTKKIYEVTGYGIYDSTAENRFCLLIDLPNNQKGTLTTLLMNPANTFPADIAKTKGKKARFDQTIRNLIVLANAIGYKQIIVLNTFPYIEGSSEKANDYYDCNINSEKFKTNKNLNRFFIEEILNNCDEILVACGDIKNDLYKEYFNIINKAKENIKIYTYAKNDVENCSALTKKGRPRHLSLQSSKNKIQYEKALSDKELCKIEIVDDSYFKIKSE